jgi:hypothetical protein
LTYFLYQSTIPGIETFSPRPLTIDLSTHRYYQLVYTLTGLLPPPLDDTPEALRARNHAAIAKVAALPPVNAIGGAPNEDAWVLHVAERPMLGVVDADAGSLEAAWPGAAPLGATPPCVDQRTEKNVSENGINSQDAAFETWMSEQPWNRGSMSHEGLVLQAATVAVCPNATPASLACVTASARASASGKGPARHC